MDKHAARYLREHRYTAERPRHERINGYTVLIGQDGYDGWKYKIKAPYEMWSLPFPTFEAAYEAAKADIF